MQKSAKTFRLDSITHDALRQKFKLKHFEAKKVFNEKYPHVQKFLVKRGIDPGKIREHSARVLGAGILSGVLFIAGPHTQKALPSPQEVVENLDRENSPTFGNPEEILVKTFNGVLPQKVRPLSREEEKFLESVVTNLTKVPARASLEGEHLNTIYGKIGLEQHLRRYPGDNISEHGSGAILKQGMAPGLGAWGYFANSKEELSPDLVEKEKWYAVVQTLYLPDWNTRQPHLKNWYKYRKVLIVNTKNASSVVASIADSGPAAWTGKHYGGSPEVMNALGGARYTKGEVLLFFVDDPENKIPLGPVEYNKNIENTLAQL